MKKSNIAGGIALILLAVYLIGNATGLIPEIPWFRIIVSLLFIWTALKGFFRREFFGGVMSLCILVWLWETEIGAYITAVPDITPWPLLGAGALLGIGLNMIFKRERKISFQYTDGSGKWREATSDDIKHESWTDGRHVKLENNFGTVSKYVKTEAFSTADIENNFGSTTVYFSNAIIANGEGVINIENNFGETRVYLPRTWRVRVTENQAFGSIKTYGAPNNDADAPLAIIKAESNFGTIKLYFE